MKRRTFIAAAVGSVGCGRLIADMPDESLELAAEGLARASESGQVEAATLYVRHGETVLTRAFGAAPSIDAVFLLASITKPMSIAAVMTLFDQRRFDLDDPVNRYLPEFSGDGRDKITMRHLMTHVSGLPDQLPRNASLRAEHAPLSEFVQEALRTPLLFEPASQYRYSSMGILLAAEVAQRISGESIAALVRRTVCKPLGMRNSALGVGQLKPESLIRCQVESAAPESGGGDADTRRWDWNSDYWRRLGSPWGGAHGSAGDLAKFLEAFLHPSGQLLKPETARQMVTNQNPPGLRPRGLGFDLGPGLGGSHTSEAAFGHGGSTGTLCWADPRSDTVFVVLTTLPSRAADPHPRDVASRRVAEAVED